MTLTLGSMSHKMFPSTLRIIWPRYLQSVKVLQLTVYEEMHLHEITFFDLDDGIKVIWNVTTFNLLGGDTITRNVTDGLADQFF